MGCEALTLRSARQRRGLIETAAHEPYVNFEARPSGCIAERWPTRLNWCLTPVIADIALAGNSVSDPKSTRLNSSHTVISYAGFCLKKNRPQTGLSPSYRPA